MATTVPISTTIQIGVMKRFPQATVPANVNRAVLTLDMAWLTDPTAFVNWGLEVSFDGGANWQHFASGSRPGGPGHVDGGGTTTDVDIEIDTHGQGWDIRGKLIRGFLGVVQGVQPLSSPQTVTGTLALS